MTLVVLDGELAVPRNPKSAYAGLKILQEKGYTVLNGSCIVERVDLT